MKSPREPADEALRAGDARFRGATSEMSTLPATPSPRCSAAPARPSMPPSTAPDSPSSRTAVGSARPRLPFVTLVSLVLLAGIVGLLCFNTQMQQASFAATTLEDRAANLTAREQTLHTESRRCVTRSTWRCSRPGPGWSRRRTRAP